jgi:hypothetical protein
MSKSRTHTRKIDFHDDLYQSLRKPISKPTRVIEKKESRKSIKQNLNKFMLEDDE